MRQNSIIIALICFTAILNLSNAATNRLRSQQLSQMATESEMGSSLSNNKVYKIFSQKNRLYNLVYVGGNEVDLRLNAQTWRAYSKTINNKVYWYFRSRNKSSKYLCVDAGKDVITCNSSSNHIYWEVQKKNGRYCLKSKTRGYQLYTKLTVRNYIFYKDYDYDMNARSNYSCGNDGQFFFQQQ